MNDGKLAEITRELTWENAQWLNREFERLREIEEAAKRAFDYWSSSLVGGKHSDDHASIEALCKTVKARR